MLCANTSFLNLRRCQAPWLDFINSANYARVCIAVNSGSFPVSFKIENGEISATWIEPGGALSGGTYTAKLAGTVSGSTIRGSYTRKKNENNPIALLELSGNIDNLFMGFTSEDAEKINLISTKLENDFSLCLSRQKP